jgi:hypothetical protein
MNMIGALINLGSRVPKKFSSADRMPERIRRYRLPITLKNLRNELARKNTAADKIRAAAKNSIWVLLIFFSDLLVMTRERAIIAVIKIKKEMPGSFP